MSWLSPPNLVFAFHSLSPLCPRLWEPSAFSWLVAFDDLVSRLLALSATLLCTLCSWLLLIPLVWLKSLWSSLPYLPFCPNSSFSSSIYFYKFLLVLSFIPFPAVWLFFWKKNVAWSIFLHCKSVLWLPLMISLVWSMNGGQPVVFVWQVRQVVQCWGNIQRENTGELLQQGGAWYEKVWILLSRIYSMKKSEINFIIYYKLLELGLLWIL